MPKIARCAVLAHELTKLNEKCGFINNSGSSPLSSLYCFHGIWEPSFLQVHMSSRSLSVRKTRARNCTLCGLGPRNDQTGQAMMSNYGRRRTVTKIQARGGTSSIQQERNPHDLFLMNARRALKHRTTTAGGSRKQGSRLKL